MRTKVCKSFFIQSLRKTNIVITVLCLLFILTGCSKNEKIDPNEYIQSVYTEYEQLAKLEDSTEQMILFKSQDRKDEEVDIYFICVDYDRFCRGGHSRIRYRTY